MTDELLFERLAAHAGPADVDPGFEDRLYAVLQAEMGRSERSSRRTMLLVAALAAILAISAAVAVGSGVIDLPWLDESPTPSPSASASASSEPSPSAEQARDPGWSAAGSMLEPSSETFTRLLDGSVLATGGSGPVADDPLASAERYDPSSGSWSATRSMLEASFNRTATLPADGRVLVAGGGRASGPLISAELFDPDSGPGPPPEAWPTASGGHTATLLPDGSVLVAGGCGDVTSDG